LSQPNRVQCYNTFYINYKDVLYINLSVDLHDLDKQVPNIEKINVSSSQQKARELLCRFQKATDVSNKLECLSLAGLSSLVSIFRK